MVRSIFKTIGAKSDLIVISFFLLTGIIIGWNRVWYLGRINFVDDFIWGSRWDRVLVGQLPYRDFFELYGPGFPIFLAPLYQFFGRGLPAIRIIHYLIFPQVVLFVLFVLLGQLGFRERKRAVAIGFLSLVFGGMIWLNSPWSFRVWLGILGVMLINRSLKSKKLLKIFLAGIIAVVIGLFSTEQGVAVLIAGLIGGIYRLLKPPRRLGEFRLIGTFSSGVIVTIGLIAWLMWKSDMLSSYIQTAFWRVPFYQNAAYGFVFPTENTLKDPFKFGWFLPFIIWAVCAIFWAVNQFKDRKYKQKKSEQTLIVMLLVLGLFGLRIYLGRTDWSYLAVDNIATWLAAIWLVSRLRYTNSLQSGKKIVIGTVLIGIVAISWIATARLDPYWKALMTRAVYPINFKPRLVYLPSTRVWLFPQEAQEVQGVLNFVDRNIPKDQEIYPFPTISGFSNLLGRITPNYFEQAWFATTAMDQWQLIYEVESRQVPWVIYSQRDDTIRLDRMSQVYILKTYQPVAYFGPYELLRRNKSWPEAELKKFFLAMTEPSLRLNGLRDNRPDNGRWLVTGNNPVWDVRLDASADTLSPTDEDLRTLVLKYQLGFAPGLANLSKTSLEVTWQDQSSNHNQIFYKEPFLFPGGWQEAWIEVPPNFNPNKLKLILSWPGAFNPHVKWIKWGSFTYIR